MQVKELLLPFGSLKAFNLVMDKNTGNSKVRTCSIAGLSGCRSCRSSHSDCRVSLKGDLPLGCMLIQSSAAYTQVKQRDVCPMHVQPLELHFVVYRSNVHHEVGDTTLHAAFGNAF